MECFKVYANEIEGRIDPFYYKPEFRKLVNRLEKIKRKSIKDISFDLKNGSTPPGGVFEEQGIPYFRSQDFNLFDFEINQHIKEEFHNKLKRSAVKPGDILLAVVGATLGVVGYVPDTIKEGNINQNVVRIRVKDKEVNPKFLAIILSSRIGQRLIFRNATIQTQSYLNNSQLGEIKIPVPPLEIQNKIVQLMDNAYSIKKSKESGAQQLLDSISDYLLDELGIKLPELKDKMTYVVNFDEQQNKRIDPYYYHPKFEEVEKAIKKGKFEVKELKDILDYYKKGIEVGSNAYVEEGIPFIRVADINDYEIKYDETDKKIRLELYKKLKEYQPKKDELLFSKDGSVGFCVVVNENKDSIISGGILRLKVKENINNFYVKTILSSKFFKLLAERESIGSIIKHLTPEVLLSIKIPLPPLAVQNKIAEEVKKRMQKAEQLQREAKEELEKAKQEVGKMILGEN